MPIYLINYTNFKIRAVPVPSQRVTICVIYIHNKIKIKQVSISIKI
jgi:hypothetical protein